MLPIVDAVCITLNSSVGDVFRKIHQLRRKRLVFEVIANTSKYKKDIKGFYKHLYIFSIVTLSAIQYINHHNC